MIVREKANKITATLKLVVTEEFYDDEASEETLRSYVEQCLEEAGLSVEVGLFKAPEPRVLTGNEIIKTTEVTTCYLEVKGERNLYGAYLQKYDDDHTLVVTDVKDVPEMIATRHARLWSARPTDEQREAVSWNMT